MRCERFGQPASWIGLPATGSGAYVGYDVASIDGMSLKHGLRWTNSLILNFKITLRWSSSCSRRTDDSFETLDMETLVKPWFIWQRSVSGLSSVTGASESRTKTLRILPDVNALSNNDNRSVNHCSLEDPFHIHRVEIGRA